MITIIPLDQRQRTQLQWIIQAVDCFVSTIKNHTDADISAAAKIAAENFFRGESGARSIYRGYDHARQRIMQRQAEQNNVIAIDQFKPRVRGAYPTH